MDLGSEGVSVYAEAKGEYTKQLCQYMVPALQRYFLDLLEEARLKETDVRKLLVSFQTLLEGIADWNIDKVQRETSTLATGTQCDYLEELITAVFIAHTKVLSAIRLTTKQKKLQITIPKVDHFLHRTLTECARLLWSNTYLFSTSGPAIERQKNLRQIENLLTDGVLQSIRSMLPVKNILREYLKEDSSDEEEEEEKEEKVEKVAEPLLPETEVVPQEHPQQEEAVAAVDTSSSTATEEVDLSGLVIIQPAAPVVPSSTPVFTGMETKFEGGAENSILEKEEDYSFLDTEEDENEIQILDEPPVALDEFEDLEKPAEPAPVPEKPAEEEFLPMEFETLE